MNTILVHRTKREDMLKVYDTILHMLSNVHLSTIKSDRESIFITLNGFMKLDFRSGDDLSKFRGIVPDYVNSDSPIFELKLGNRSDKNYPVIDDIYKYIEYFVVAYRNML